MKFFTLLVAMAFLAAGCQSNQNSTSVDEPEEAQAAEESAAEDPRFERRRPPREQSAPTRRAAPASPSTDQMEGRLQQDGPGLTFIIDSSSPDALEQSLDLIADETSEQQFRQLRSSIDMLRFYSLQPNEEFYQSLDGLTGEDVIDMARERRGRRQR